MAKPNLALIPAVQGSKLFSVLPSSGVGDFDFSRSGKATRINSQGLIEEVDGGVSRLNYPMIDGKVVGCPHHILEPQSTNLIEYSEDFSQSVWTKGNTSVTSGFLAPDGTNNAWKVLATASGTSIYNIAVYGSIGGQPTSVKTNSFFVKPNGQRWIYLLPSSDGSNVVFFDLQNGVIGTEKGVSEGKIETYSNGWYRISLTEDASVSYSNFGIGFCDGDDIFTYTQSSNSIFLYGAQLEQQSYPTSYIKSNGSPTTRQAETCNGAGDAATFSDSEGVLMVEISALADEGGVRAISLNDGSVQNRISIRYNSTSNQIQYQYTVGSSVQANILANVVDVKTPHKIAVKYKLNDFELFIDGISRGTDLVGSIMPSGTLTNLDINGSSVYDYFYGNVKQVQYYNSALTESELEKITSWTSFTDMATSQLYSIK